MSIRLVNYLNELINAVSCKIGGCNETAQKLIRRIVNTLFDDTDHNGNDKMLSVSNWSI